MEDYITIIDKMIILHITSTTEYLMYVELE